MTLPAPTTVEQPQKMARPTQRVQLAEAEQTIAELREQVRAWEQKWEDCWARLNQEASSRDWCGEYDRICDELDGIPRPIAMNVSITAEITSQPNRDQVALILGISAMRINLQLLTQPTIEWSMRLVRVVNGRPDRCQCDQLTWTTEVRNYLDGHSIAHTNIGNLTARCDSPNCANKPAADDEPF